MHVFIMTEQKDQIFSALATFKRTVGGIPNNDFQAILAKTTIDGDALTTMQDLPMRRSQVIL